VVVRERTVGNWIGISVGAIHIGAAFYKLPHTKIKLTRLAINQRAPLSEIRRAAPRGVSVDEYTAIDRQVQSITTTKASAGANAAFAKIADLLPSRLVGCKAGWQDPKSQWQWLVLP